MKEIEEINQEIDQLRKNLKKLVEQKNYQLNHPDIVKKSQELDAVLNEYIEVIKSKK